MTEQLNNQLNHEFFSAYLYLSMSAYCSEKGFNGCANWFMVQYQEETSHAMKMYQYLLDHGASVTLDAINTPTGEFESVLDCFEKGLAHEQFMTGNFNTLCETAMQEKDHATYGFLQWYVNEQVEEEATAGDIVSKLKIFGGDGQGMFMIDNELAGRVFVNEAAPV